MRPLLGVAHHRPGGVVELEITAAGGGEGLHRVMIGAPEIVEEGIEVGINLFADRHAALPEMQYAGCRYRHLGHNAAMLFQEFEIVDMRVAGKADFADCSHAFGLGVDAVKLDAFVGVIKFDSFQSAEEIEMPPGAAEFAVGRELEPDLGLFLDDLLDLAVFHRPERVGFDFALGEFGARLLQWRGAQQAADHVGAERRRGTLGHVMLPDSTPFVPAKAGTQRLLSYLDSRLRGNERSISPTPRSPVRQSSSAWPIARLQPRHSLPRSRRSRIAATGTTDRARQISSPPRCAS